MSIDVEKLISRWISSLGGSPAERSRSGSADVKARSKLQARVASLISRTVLREWWWETLRDRQGHRASDARVVPFGRASAYGRAKGWGNTMNRTLGHYFFRRRTSRGLMAAALVAALATGVVVIISGGAAGARGTTHTLVAGPKLDYSNSIEGAANATFSCNDSTGAFKFKAVNIQVIQDDHTTRWPSLAIDWEFDNANTFRHVVTRLNLQQNTTNGLFTASLKGNFDDLGATTRDCATGATIGLFDFDTDGALLNMNWSVS
jgi:hypothetical protein